MNTSSFPMAVARGCGTRVQGGIYAEVALGPDGLPFEHFLLDPPVPVGSKLSMAAIGTSYVVRGGITHIADVVGKVYYPNVADFVEEARHFGISRRLSKSLDFSKLTPESRLLLAHDHALVLNFKDYKTWNCPKGIPGHQPEADPSICCSGIWWEDISGGEPTGTGRQVTRKMPSFSYTARSTPKGVTPKYQRAFFLSVPIGRLVVVDGKGKDAALTAAGKSKLPVAVVEK